MVKDGLELTRWEFLERLIQVEKRYYKESKTGRIKNYDHNSFADRRINQKFSSIVVRYRDVIDRDMLFDFAKDIIEDIVLEKEYVYISADEKKDDISYIITTLEQRINDKIDKYRGTYRERKNGQDKKVTAPFIESLDEVLEDDEGEKWTLHDKISNENNVFYCEEVSQSDEEVDKALKKIYERAKLTEREIQVLQALERTRDNIYLNTFYNKAEASRILGDCTRANVSKIFSNIKKKIAKVYKIEYTRQDRINELYGLLDSVESEIEIINYVNENLEDDFDTEEIIYKVDPVLIQYFLKNRFDESTYRSDMMRKFVTYFIKEIYSYIELLKENDKIGEDKEEVLFIA